MIGAPYSVTAELLDHFKVHTVEYGMLYHTFITGQPCSPWQHSNSPRPGKQKSLQLNNSRYLNIV